MPLSPPAEWLDLQRVLDEAGARVDCECLGEVEAGGLRLPLLAIGMGNDAPGVPAVGFFGGVHGLERIGVAVVVAWLAHLVRRLDWDAVLHEQLAQVRLVFMPLVNPGGLALGTRANPNGVDLMRNAPVEARERVPPLVGGQRVSATLPWYRGAAGAAMEVEAEALCRLVERELFGRGLAVAVDCHSGFGLRDRIWFPYAHTAAPIGHLAELHAMATLLERSHPHHRYVFEPQSRQYLAHGDLWDHLYLQAAAQAGDHLFLPLTLEMGSWRWVKKNPRQLFSRQGIFNPLIEHRQQRVLRQHLAWFDFVTRAVISHERWLPSGDERQTQHESALGRWYGEVTA